MSDDDRYDLGISLLTGLIMVGALLLSAPIWALALILMVGLDISVFRHIDLRPDRR